MRTLHSTTRMTSLLVALFAVFGIALSASATIHPLAGNARFQAGEGFPYPISFIPAPDGAIFPVTGAVITQTGSDPMALRVPVEAMKSAKTPAVVPVYNTNPALFQIFTSVTMTFPSAGATNQTWSAGGRTGASTVSYCPGQTVTPTGNPGCASGLAGPHPGVKGIMVYTKTSNQFGGPIRSRYNGVASVALVSATGAPCAGCVALMAGLSPLPTAPGGPGGPFGPAFNSTGGAPSPGRLTVTVTANGLITNAMVTPSGLPGIPNPGTTFRAPWTTGMLSISQPSALGGAQVFTLTGSDARVSGVGSISLVAGGLGNRTITGPFGARGWMNLTIGSPLGALPSMTAPGLAALTGLLGLTAAYGIKRRRK